MRSTSQPLRRNPIIYLLFGAFFTFIIFSSFRHLTNHVRQPRTPTPLPLDLGAAEHLLNGKAIAPKLENATAKAELGRAAWKLFHTTFASFPDEPTKEESEALRIYVGLFQRLYPCGECAEHFGVILKKFPPQVATRSTAAAWGCHVHNEVNKSLKKEMFDCSKIGNFYNCGCAEGEEKEKGKKKQPKDLGPLGVKKMGRTQRG